MNNSRLQQEVVHLSLDQQNIQAFEDRAIKLRKLLTAVEKVNASKEWSTLKSEVFDPAVETLHRSLLLEAKKEHPDTEKLNRLSGQITQCERFDLKKLEGAYRLELTNIIQNYGKEE